MSNEVSGEHVLDAVATARDIPLPESPLEPAHNNNDTPGEKEPEKKEEEALDWSQVIELQAFLDRKEWIAQKIHLLETMPPIELFAGLEALMDLTQTPPGVPTKAQLEIWQKEQEKIESEAEQFDAKDLSRLKKFAKSAASRNLSPADTDLIEVTLTTLLALDKLLHLLRGRADILERLSLRITWDDQRIGAWKERRSIIDGLDAFVKNRARWSPSAYDQPSSNSTPLAVLPPTTVGSSTGDNFSRAARYRLAETLSHDAAQFASRFTALKHTLLGPSGKTLDKLIEKVTVPDQFLDAQDKLEDEIAPMDTLGKFAMQVVMQWKKADEVYGELKKNQAAAEALQQEIAEAFLLHPSSRQDAAFATRSRALTSRLTLVGNPASSRSFPRPVHPSFTDQDKINDTITKTLTDELTTATALARQATESAAQYHVACKLTKHVETTHAQIVGFTTQLEALTNSLLNGVAADDADGTPPNLSTTACLDVKSHSAYLALLPSTAATLDQIDANGSRSLADCRITLLKLDSCAKPDPAFRSNVVDSMEKFEEAKAKMREVKAEVIARVARLKEVRKIWTAITDTTSVLDRIRAEVADAMDSQKWRAQMTANGAPLTPDSPSPDLAPITITAATIVGRLDDIGSQMPVSIGRPLSTVSPALNSTLSSHLKTRADALKTHLGNVKGLTKMWEAIQKQASLMAQIRDATQEFEQRVDTLALNIEDSQHSALDLSTAIETLAPVESKHAEEVAAMQAEVQAFTDSLPAKIPFIGRPDGYFSGPLRGRHSSVSSTISRSDSLSLAAPFTLSVDVSTIDHGVRSDANAYSLAVTNAAHGLGKRLDHLRLARLARETDQLMQPVIEEVGRAKQNLSSCRADLAVLVVLDPKDISDQPLLDKLTRLKGTLETLGREHRSSVSRCMSPVRESLQRLQNAPAAHDATGHSEFVFPRTRAFEDIERTVHGIAEDITSLHEQVDDAMRKESERLEAERLRLEEEERQRLAEEARLAAEAEEARRQEEEIRLAEEARLAAEEAAQKEVEEKARQEEEERERLAAEERERQRLAEELARKEAEAAAQREAEERERLEAEARAKEEAERLAQERAEVEAQAKREADERLRLENEERARKLAEIEAREEAVGRAEESARMEAEERRLAKQKADDTTARLAEIVGLRMRLNDLNLHGHARSSSPTLPTEEFAANLQQEYSAIEAIADKIPDSKLGVDVAFNSELNSLKFELDASVPLLDRIRRVSAFAKHVANCDTACSDMLEHIDSYPAAPASDMLSSSHVTNLQQPPEEQLKARLTFCRQLTDAMKAGSKRLIDDERVVGERSRVEQTWKELWDMALDRLQGSRSRPSTASGASSTSGRESVTSMQSQGKARAGKAIVEKKPYLTAAPRRPSSSSNGAPSRAATSRHPPNSRNVELPKRPPSTMSNNSSSISQRSISAGSSLYNSTFASRQRTSSLTAPPPGLPGKVVRPRTESRPQPPGSQRPTSPRSDHGGKRPVASSSKTSLDAPRPRKKYVANPKNKLDMAVGQVVNQLPIGVSIEAVNAGDDWQDQSGKYWIGDAEPKLCFCRILRSHTVMVRVGGGWVELSRFIRDHFADVFRLLPTLPEGGVDMGSAEERWISSATLLEGEDNPETPDAASRLLKTPEPKPSHISPTINISTPSGKSPYSIHSSSGGSPLAGLQFMRRAEDLQRPITPSKSPILRTGQTVLKANPSRPWKM